MKFDAHAMRNMCVQVSWKRENIDNKFFARGQRAFKLVPKLTKEKKRKRKKKEEEEEEEEEDEKEKEKVRRFRITNEG